MNHTMSQPVSFPSSMDADDEPRRQLLNLPTQQPPPPANVSLGPSPLTSAIHGGQTATMNQIQTLAITPEISAAPALSTTSCSPPNLVYHPATATPSVLTTPASNTAATRPLGFLTLPEELKARTLSFLPPREVVRCRAVCSVLRDTVDHHAAGITRPTVLRNHAQLQDRIDTLAQIKPYDLISFVSCFRYWMAQRGTANYLRQAWLKPFVA